MFGFGCRDSKIIEGIKNKDASFVYKFIKKYKKEVFKSIADGDKDYIFSNIVINMIAYIENNNELKLDETVKDYIIKAKNNQLNITGFKIYNDRDLLKYIVKHWEHKCHSIYNYCEVFNSTSEEEISESGNEPCYTMITVNNDKIHIKQFVNDFSVYYNEDFEYYNSDFEHAMSIELKTNLNNEVTVANLTFGDNFNFQLIAQTFTDSDNIIRLKDMMNKNHVKIIMEEGIKTVS